MLCRLVLGVKKKVRSLCVAVMLCNLLYECLIRGLIGVFLMTTDLKLNFNYIY